MARADPRWRPWAHVLEVVGFVVVLFAYLLPFVNFNSQYRGSLALPGIAVFVGGIVYLVAAPWPNALEVFVAFSLPVIAAITGLSLSRRRTWKGAAGRLALAGCGFAGLALGYLWQPGFDFASSWAFGYYVAVVAFLLAAAGAALRLTVVVRFGTDQQGPPESAWSASQELLQKDARK